MVEARQGALGLYYGSPYNSSAPLTIGQMQVNAEYLYHAFVDSGWTLESLCGMLGNMQVESGLNPGRWQDDRVGGDPTGHGYGLVQWTPYTNYTNWAVNYGWSDPSIMDANVSRINYEMANGLQWIPTVAYPFTFGAFKSSTASPDYLAMAFLANYERPGDPNQPIRGVYAMNWYNYLRGLHPPTPTGGKKSKFPWVLYANKLRTNHLTK